MPKPSAGVPVVLAALFVMAGCDGLSLAPPIPGAIRVRGVEGQGELYLDGIARGPIAAEQELGGLAAGTHVVELRRDAVVVTAIPVEVRPGLVADVRLEAPSAPQPATVAAPPPQGPARYRLSSEPNGAEVVVDGVAAGRTPLEMVLTPGAHHVELRAEGHAPIDRSIDASDGEDREIVFTLEPSAVDVGTPLIRPGVTEVRGSLSREVITRVIRSHVGEVRSCYERELARRPGLAGRLTVSFVISPTGAVQIATVSSTTMDDPAVESCVAAAARRWRFPAPEGGGVVRVSYPFVFESAP